MRQADGTTKEFHSQLLPRYGRRTGDVDAAILGSSLAGVISRRIRTALKPLLAISTTRVPVHARAEMKRDYHRTIHADDGLAARAAYDAFVKKWTTLCPAVTRSIEETGLDLLTFYDFPKAMWKSLRTTNTLENLNREFRRRTKTQVSFGTEAAAITLLYGLVAFGQIVLRRIDGHEHLPAFLAKEWSQAA